VQLARVSLVEPSATYHAPLDFLKEHVGPEVYTESELKNFEDDIISVFESPTPEQTKKWGELQAKWKLDDESTSVLRAYYSFLIFDGDPNIVGSKAELFEFVKKQTLDYHLQKNPELRARYDYFVKNVGKLSVPEMADTLGITQGTVYQELSFFNLSIVDAFKDDIRNGEDQASRFVRHHLSIEQRGVAWDRFLKSEREDAILVSMFSEGISYAQIAAALNKLAGIDDPKHPDLRTEESVAGRISTLGLSQQRPRQSLNISIHPYGPVKVAGSLVPATAVEYLFDNRSKGFAWCAENLGVTEVTLQNFIRRQHLEGIFELSSTRRRQRPVVVKVTATNIEKLRNDAHDKIINYAAIHGSLPNRNDWYLETGHQLNKYAGMGSYALGKEKAHQSLHDGPLSTYQGLLARAQNSPSLAKADAATKDRILKQIQSLIDEVNTRTRDIAAQRSDALDSAVSYIVTNKRVPSGPSEWKDALGVMLTKFVGTADYKPLTGAKATARLYDNPIDAYQALYEHAQNSQKLKSLPEAIREELLIQLKRRVDTYRFEELPLLEQQNLYHDQLIGFMIKEQHVPLYADWSKLPDLTWARYFGNDKYRESQASARFQLYPNQFEAYRALLNRFESDERALALAPEKRDVIKKGLEAKIEEYRFDILPLAEKQNIIHGNLVSFIVHNKRLPKSDEWQAALKIHSGIYFGTGQYKPGRSGELKALYTSTAKAYEGFMLYLKNSPKFLELSEATRAEILSSLQAKLESAQLRAP